MLSEKQQCVAMNQTHIKWTNHLFAGLPMNIWSKWEDLVEPVHLTAGQVLFESGDALKHVYFPFTAIISLTRSLQNGESIELAMVGAEGLVDTSVFMKSVIAVNRGVVRRTGYAYKLDAESVKSSFSDSLHVVKIFLRYTQALIAQISQTSACMRHHSVEQQLCRWLLFYSDRTSSMLVKITQEEISHILGVRRERVVKVAKNLQSTGVLAYSRGTIEIVDKQYLLDNVCECYPLIRSEYERLRPIAVLA